MILRDEIVFVDRDGDVLSVIGRGTINPVPDPVVTITQGIKRDEWESGSAVINTGRSQTVIFTEDEFRSFVKDMWERVLGESFPNGEKA